MQSIERELDSVISFKIVECDAGEIGDDDVTGDFIASIVIYEASNIGHGL